MLSTHALGLAPSLRRAAFSPGKARPSMQHGEFDYQYAHQVLISRFKFYEPQLTWVGSIFNRITVLCGFSLAYLVAPGTLDSAHVIEFVHGLPDAVKYTGKFILALPFSFHSWNGIRHLLWDSGKFLTVKGAYSIGYAVLGATTISTLVLMFQ
ncbi:SDHC, cytochrome b subunit of succinate dehydrogenase [Lentinula edodes]|nr:SDHC, cytochrome b subunit of succinate dehydrogenase [Lentinula edodes]